MMNLPKTLNESHCYISNHPNHQVLNHQHRWGFTLDGWCRQRVVSRGFFGGGGVATIRACEEHYGMFVWATEFSNVHSLFSFTEPNIVVDGEKWSGSEAYYQAMKSNGLPHHEMVKELMIKATPSDAYAIGNHYPKRKDWFQVSVDVMAKAVHAKFSQNEDIKNLLLSTGSHPLVQVKRGDRFWGTGPDNNGKNMLGKLLMELRQALSGSERTFRGLKI